MQKIKELLQDYCGVTVTDEDNSSGYVRLQLMVLDDTLWFGSIKKIAIQLPMIRIMREYFADGGLVKWNWTVFILSANSDLISRLEDTLAMVLSGHQVSPAKTQRTKKPTIQKIEIKAPGKSIEEGFAMPHVYYDLNVPDLETGKGAYRVSPDRDGKEVKRLMRVYKNSGMRDN